MALRFYTDRIDASRVQRTPSGMVRVDATVSKAGVYTYRNADGTQTREYLPPEELARADSLATLEDVAVTNRHPSGMVNSKNWNGVSIGHARNARQDGTGKDTAHVATLVIAREDAQSKIGTELIEVSRGVQVRVDPTPGVTPWGEKYDAVQRDVIYNHVAVGPRGWNRQGPDVALRLDAAGDETPNTSCCATCAARADAHLPWDECMAKAMAEYNDEATARKVCGSIKAQNDGGEKSMKIKYDGKEIEFKTDAEAQAFFDGLSKTPAASATPDLSAAVAAEKARADAAQARLDAIEAERKRDARKALETSARGVLGETQTFDSALPDRSVRLAVLAKLTPEVKYDGKSDTYVEAAYDYAISREAPAAGENRSDSIAAALHGAGGTAPAAREDAADKAITGAQERNRQRATEGYKGKLSISAS